MKSKKDAPKRKVTSKKTPGAGKKKNSAPKNPTPKKGTASTTKGISTQFQKGNNFWTLRSKHGRDRLFTDPDSLWQAACEYFAHCDETPWFRNEAIKSGLGAGSIIQVPTQRPYTLSGLCLFLNVNPDYLNQFKKSLVSKTDPSKPEYEQSAAGYSEIITRIEEIIRTQKFEGAVVGAFNANIIARDLGLVDKKDMTTDGESLNKGYYEFLKARRTKKEGSGDTA